MPFQLETIGYGELALRLGLMCIFGFLLGYDREAKEKPIGYQSYIIIGLISCLIAIMGEEIYAKYEGVNSVLRIDMGKIISGTLTGIGFLGAGAIIKRDHDVVIGTATGASIWGAGGLGLMVGFGFYTLCIIGFAVIWFVLTLLPKIFK
jgi:putative Mg2+ transporter-C (MgtC) family protein